VLLPFLLLLTNLSLFLLCNRLIDDSMAPFFVSASFFLFHTSDCFESSLSFVCLLLTMTMSTSTPTIFGEFELRMCCVATFSSPFN
jgi:hypothetical protein